MTDLLARLVGGCWQVACLGAVPWTAVEAEANAEERSQAWEQCGELAREENILDEFVIELSRIGVVGEGRAAKLIYLAVTSRLLEWPVSVAPKGPSSGGKSFVVELTLKFFPPQAFYGLTAMSDRALAYSSEPLPHRHLVICEAAGMASDFATYLIRSLLSKGRLLNMIDRAALLTRAMVGLLVSAIRTKNSAGSSRTCCRMNSWTSAVKPLQIEAWTPMLNRLSDAQVDAALGDSTAHVLHRDYETRSQCVLKSAGAYRYAADPRTTVLCAAYAVDDDPVQLWTAGDPVPPEFIEAAHNPTWTVVAHNDQFEAAIEQHPPGAALRLAVDPARAPPLHDGNGPGARIAGTADAAADALELANRKDAAGQRLMHQTSKPRRPHKDEDPAGTYWFDDRGTARAALQLLPAGRGGRT